MKRAKKALVITVAIILILFGIVGLFLPFLQGLLFIAIGAVLLSLYSPRMRGFLDREERRSPTVAAVLKHASRWAHRIVDEI